MGWVAPAAKNAAKYGAKYGPHAKVAWEIAGKQVQSAARARLDVAAQRRKAFAHAETTSDGSVLRAVDHGEPVFVVFSGGDPVASYPELDRPLVDLVARADMTKRTTPEQWREQQIRAKVKRIGAKVRRPHTASTD